MPDWLDLSPEQIGAILDYFAANGPEQKEPDEYPANIATAEQIEAGRKLFDGETRLAFGGQSCSSCHRVSGRFNGGTFAPDLTHAYDKYRDAALTLFLKNPCSPRTPEMDSVNYLKPTESFALKAFMAQVDGKTKFTPPPPQPPKAPGGKPVDSTGAKGGTL